MNVSEQLDQFIAENGGNARDALNVALARLKAAEVKIVELQRSLNITQQVDTIQAGAVVTGVKIDSLR